MARSQKATRAGPEKATTTRAPQGTTRAGAGNGDKGDQLDSKGQVFAAQLTKVAVRTLYVALAGDEQLLQAMRDNGKYTPEFARLHDTDVPEAVRAWVRENCWNPGVVRDAVESEVRIALARSRAKPEDGQAVRFESVPRKLLPGKYGERKDEKDDPGPGNHAPWHNCDPLCIPP